MFRVSSLLDDTRSDISRVRLPALGPAQQTALPQDLTLSFDRPPTHHASAPLRAGRCSAARTA
ncbi:hypothetical protein ABZ901_17640 [Actinacidiphila alni]|uniref:hypothetical protein n=1 Tax=Actinacidiphila alni TaxID=380248 RepID=UPI0033D4B75B